MTITDTLLSQKTHIIYGVIIVVIASVGYHFFKKDPEQIIKTLTKIETKIQQVEKVVTKDKIVYKDRTITTHKANGDVVVDVSHESDKEVSHSDTNTKTKTETTVTKTEVQTFMKNYSVEIMFPIINQSLNVNTNPLDTQLILGVRVFSFPVFVQAGTNLHFNQALVGLRLEL